MEEDKQQPMEEQVKQESEKVIKSILEKGIKMENVDFLYKMVDIYKDISNIDYWDAKKEDMDMRYKAYGRDSYNEGSYGKYEDNRFGRRMRDSRGRYMGGHNEYRNEDTMRTLMSSYRAYTDSKDAYEEGSYGAKEDSMISLDYMLQSVVDFMHMLKKDADSQEEMDLIKHYSKKISEM